MMDGWVTTRRLLFAIGLVLGLILWTLIIRGVIYWLT